MQQRGKEKKRKLLLFYDYVLCSGVFVCFFFFSVIVAIVYHAHVFLYFMENRMNIKKKYCKMIIYKLSLSDFYNSNCHRHLIYVRTCPQSVRLSYAHAFMH